MKKFKDGIILLLVVFSSFGALPTVGIGSTFRHDPYSFQEIQNKLILAEHSPVKYFNPGYYRGYCLGGMRDVDAGTMDAGMGGNPVLDFDFVLEISMRNPEEINIFSKSNFSKLAEGYRHRPDWRLDHETNRYIYPNVSERILPETLSDPAALELAMTEAHSTTGRSMPSERSISAQYVFTESSYSIPSRQILSFKIGEIRSVYQEEYLTFFRLRIQSMETLSHYNCIARSMIGLPVK